MTCRRELERLQDLVVSRMRSGEKDPYRSGYFDGYMVAIDDALEIVEAHEDEGE